MSVRMRYAIGFGISFALSLSIGCQAVPTVPTGNASRVAPKPTKTGTETGAANSAVRHLPLESAQRMIALTGQPVELIGKVKLLSDKGMGLISNNSGGLISNNAGGLISNNAGGLISNNAGGLIANNAGGLTSQARAYGVLQAQEENLLADAQIEVLDAAGQVLVGPDKKPLTATTDQTGAYSFKSPLPAENLVLRIRLYNGGQLFAFVTADASGAKRTIDIDTASSLGASFVLSRYVKKNQGVFNRLPETEAKALNQALEKARGLLKTKAPSYTPEDLTAAADALQAQAPEVKASFERIEAILLAGQKDLGNGLPATEVALATPMGLALDAMGMLYIAETSGGRIRRVDDQGRIQLFAGAASAISSAEGQSARESDLGGPTTILFGPDGSLYLGDGAAFKIRKITPDGKLYTLAGNGQRLQGAVGVAGTSTSLMSPGQLAMGPDGLIYFSEQPRGGSLQGRILYIDAQGKLQQVPASGPEWAGADVSGLTFGPDGTLYALWTGKDEACFVAARKPGQQSWEILLRGEPVGSFTRLAVTPDGQGLVFGLKSKGQVLRFDLASKALTPLAGKGTSGFSGDGVPALQAELSEVQGLIYDKQGRLWLNDTGNNLVRRIELDGRIVTVAGSTGLSQNGDSLTVAINQPGGVVADPQGRLVLAEGASSTIKRLEGKNLSVIAGTTKGYSGDGGPATSAQLNTPTGLAYSGTDLYFVDTANSIIRKIDASGTISTVAGGSGTGGHVTERRLPALSAGMSRPTGLAIAPDGLPTWADNNGNQILHLTKDGQVEVLAGSLAGTRGDAGDGGKATESVISGPLSVVYDKNGNLYFTDTGNMRVRKIDTAGTITTVAGIPASQVLAKMMSGGLSTTDGPALQSALMGPCGIAIDAEGQLYISEAGTAKLSYLAGSERGATPLPLEMLPKVPARVRKLSADGTLTTIAGPGGKVLNGTEGDNSLILPLFVMVDPLGRLIISDAGNNQVKMVPKSAL